MFHKATNVTFKQGTRLEVRFQDGVTKRFDINTLFQERPELKALKKHKLFETGKLCGSHTIKWDEALCLDTETIYISGSAIRIEEKSIQLKIADTILSARSAAGLSQKQLAELSGIDQSDISKIERGVANPSVNTLDRIAKALGKKLTITIENKTH